MNTIIVCIPGVFPNIGEDRIRRAFTDLDIGEIVRIDIVKPKIENPETQETPKNKKALNRVFVHLNLNTTRQAVILKEKLTQGKQIKIVYDQPWFWNISLYKKKEKAPEEPKQFKHKKATLKFEDDDDEPVTEAAAAVVIKQEQPAAAAAPPQKMPKPNVATTETICSQCFQKGHIDGLCLVEDSKFFIPPKPIDYNLDGQQAPKKKIKIVIDSKKPGEK